MNNDFKCLRDWVTYRMYRGQYMFSKKDAVDVGLPISGEALNNSLMRMGKRGEIMSPWQNFYVIVPTECRSDGFVSPTFYMDGLMEFLGRDYYVAHMSAASLHGAGHQRVMAFQVMVDGGAIRSGVKNGTRLVFTTRNKLPMAFVHKVKTLTGSMNVADAELTALDIVSEEKKVGGLSRVAEVLVELSEVMRFDENKLPLLDFFTAAVIQRLGYLLDYIDEKDLADSLYELLRLSGKTMRKVPLKQMSAFTDQMSVSERWKVIENCELDIDEI